MTLLFIFGMLLNCTGEDLCLKQGYVYINKNTVMVATPYHYKLKDSESIVEGCALFLGSSKLLKLEKKCGDML